MTLTLFIIKMFTNMDLFRHLAVVGLLWLTGK